MQRQWWNYIWRSWFNVRSKVILRKSFNSGGKFKFWGKENFWENFWIQRKKIRTHLTFYFTLAVNWDKWGEKRDFSLLLQWNVTKLIDHKPVMETDIREKVQRQRWTNLWRKWFDVRSKIRIILIEFIHFEVRFLHVAAVKWKKMDLIWHEVKDQDTG